MRRVPGKHTVLLRVTSRCTGISQVFSAVVRVFGRWAGHARAGRARSRSPGKSGLSRNARRSSGAVPGRSRETRLPLAAARQAHSGDRAVLRCGACAGPVGSSCLGLYQALGSRLRRGSGRRVQIPARRRGHPRERADREIDGPHLAPWLPLLRQQLGDDEARRMLCRASELAQRLGRPGPEPRRDLANEARLRGRRHRGRRGDGGETGRARPADVVVAASEALQARGSSVGGVAQ